MSGRQTVYDENTDFTESDQDDSDYVSEGESEDEEGSEIDDYSYPEEGYDGNVKKRVLALPPPLFTPTTGKDEGSSEEQSEGESEEETPPPKKKAKPTKVDAKPTPVKRDLKPQPKSRHQKPSSNERKKSTKRKESPPKEKKPVKSKDRHEDKANKTPVKQSSVTEDVNKPKPPKDLDMETDSLLYLLCDPRKMKPGFLKPMNVPELTTSIRNSTKNVQPTPNVVSTGSRTSQKVSSIKSTAAVSTVRSTKSSGSSSKEQSRVSSTDSRRRSTDSRRQSTDSRKSSQSRRESTDSRKSSQSRRESTDSRRQSTDSRRESSDSRRESTHSTDSRRETSRSKRRSGDSRASSTDVRRSSDSRRKSTDSRRKSTDSRRKSTDSRRESTRSDLSDKWKEREDKRRRQGRRGDDMRNIIINEELKEKRELMYEFWLMEQNGIPVSKHFTVDDDLDEMRFEYHKLRSECDIKDKVRTGWNMFSAINSIAELVNERVNPFNVSIEGWVDDLDNTKDQYEPHFRKMYKALSCRFQVKPGVQIAVMYLSQFLLFIVPKLLKKSRSNRNNNAIENQDVKKTVYPWSKPGGKIVEVDDQGKALPEDKTVLTELRQELNVQREHMMKQQKMIEHQQRIINNFQANQARMKSIHTQEFGVEEQPQQLQQSTQEDSNTNTSTKTEYRAVEDNITTSSSPPTEAEVPAEPVEEGQEEEEGEEGAEEQQEEGAEEGEESEGEESEGEEGQESEGEESEGEEEGEPSQKPAPLPNGINPYDIDMPAPTPSIGAFKELLPVMKKFRDNSKSVNKGLDMHLYTTPPEMPDSLKSDPLYQSTASSSSAQPPAAPTTKSTKKSTTLVL